MDERLFSRLTTLLQSGPVVLATVLDAHGATPRKSGSRMLVTGRESEFSVGGGEAEARVIEAARSLLANAVAPGEVHIDLSGKPGAAGVCGGTMRVGLRRWDGAADQARARVVSSELYAGRAVKLTARDLGTPCVGEVAQANARLLIVGAGHCGLALYDLARHLDFDLWVFDPRPHCFAAGQFAEAQCLSGAYDELRRALDTEREVYAVLLNRDYAGDVATLAELCAKPPKFMSMMGSRKRIAEVLAALPQHADLLQSLQAPVGIDIGAETPHEISVSILAQLVQARRRIDQCRLG